MSFPVTLQLKLNVKFIWWAACGKLQTKHSLSITRTLSLEHVEQPALPSGILLCRSPGFSCITASVATQSPSPGDPEWICHSPCEHTLSVASPHPGLGLNSTLLPLLSPPHAAFAFVGQWQLSATDGHSPGLGQVYGFRAPCTLAIWTILQ